MARRTRLNPTATAADFTPLLNNEGRAASATAKLPYDPVVLIIGDSQALGSPAAGDQSSFVSSYVADANVQILSVDGTFKQYVPGTRSAQSAYSGSDVGNVGTEIGIISRFRSLWPQNKLYLIKRAAAGSTVTRKTTASSQIGTVTGTISGNILTVTANTGSATFGQGSILTGGTFPAGSGIVVLFGTGTANQWYIGKIDQTSNLALGTIGSTTYNFYNYTTDIWSLDEGALYRNNAGSTGSYKQWRTRALEGLAAMTTAGLNPRIVGVVNTLGTNDMAFQEPSQNYLAMMRRLISQFRQDFAAIPGGDRAAYILPRVAAGSQYSDAIRDAQLSLQSQRRVFVVNTDDMTRHDGTHWDIASCNTIGQRSGDIIFGASLGI